MAVSDLVTVVVATKNRHTLVTRAVASGLADQGIPVEIVVVDDASQPEVLDIWRDTGQSVRLVRRTRSTGVCAARNAGLAAARGNWVTFLDDDDELTPGALGRAVAAARASRLPRPVGVLSVITEVTDAGDFAGVREPVSVSRGNSWLWPGGLRNRCQAHNSLVAPTREFRDVGGFDERLRACEHDELFLRLTRGMSVEALTEPGYVMRVNANRPSVRKDLRGTADSLYYTARRHRPELRANRRLAAEYLMAVGRRNLSTGRPVRAARSYAVAVAWNPGMVGRRIGQAAPLLAERARSRMVAGRGREVTHG